MNYSGWAPQTEHPVGRPGSVFIAPPREGESQPGAKRRFRRQNSLARQGLGQFERPLIFALLPPERGVSMPWQFARWPQEAYFCANLACRIPSDLVESWKANLNRLIRDWV